MLGCRVKEVLLGQDTEATGRTSSFLLVFTRS
jgi:hypothetical protein